MTLDPQAKAFLDQLNAANLPDAPAMTPRDARLQMEVSTMMLGRAPVVGRADDHTIPGPGGPIRIRVTAPEGSGPFPALVYFHGGGWVVGNLSSHNHLCRAITNAAKIAVVSVDYRLAPEHPFPAAIDDAEAATIWVAEHADSLGIDPQRLAVGGDSAGGNLAAVVARRIRDRGTPRLALQLLLYPATNADFNTPSYLEKAEGYMLTRAAMQWYWDQYLPDPAQRTLPDAAPLRVKDLAGLPPALVMTAEYDPLCDEGEAYAQRMAEAGVAVTLRRFDGMIHGFLRRFAFFDQGKQAVAEIAQALNQAFETI